MFTDRTNKVVILSIDPGTKYFGASVILIDLSDGLLVPELIFSDTIYVDTLIPSYTDKYPFDTTRELRQRIIEDLTTDLLVEWEPDYLSCEDNYYGKFANAFRALVECVATTKRSAYNYNPVLPVYMVEPSVAKKAVGVTGKIPKSERKTIVQKMIKTNAGKMFISKISLKRLSEHAFDSIAIGLWFAFEYIKEIKWLVVGNSSLLRDQTVVVKAPPKRLLKKSSKKRRLITG